MKPPDQARHHRVRVIGEMLELLSKPINASSVRNNMAYKIAFLFRVELEQCAANHGIMGGIAGDNFEFHDWGAALHDLVKRVMQCLIDSTQDIEGYNNTIKHAKCRASDLRLLNCLGQVSSQQGSQASFS